MSEQTFKIGFTCQKHFKHDSMEAMIPFTGFTKHMDEKQAPGLGDVMSIKSLR